MSYFLEHLFFTFPSIMLFVVHFMFLVQLYLRFVLAFFYTWFLFALSCKYCSAGVCCFKGFAVLFCFTMRTVFFVICPIQTEYKQTFLFCNIFRRKTFVIPSYHEVSQPKKMWKKHMLFFYVLRRQKTCACICWAQLATVGGRCNPLFHVTPAVHPSENYMNFAVGKCSTSMPI